MSQQVSRLLAEGNVRGLCRLLRVRDPIVRSQAAQALGQLAESAAVPFLEQALRGETDLNTKRHAIGALGAIGDPEAIRTLTHLLYSANRMTVHLAEQALSILKIPEADAALAVRDALSRSEWDTLAALDEEESRALEPVLGSPLFLTWASGKRQRVLGIALALGLTPPQSMAAQLKEMGIFLGSIHTLGDVLNGLRRSDMGVRAAAIATLSKSKGRWIGSVLHGSFRREARRGNQVVATAAAREMARRGDMRGIEYFRTSLYEGDASQAAWAANALAKINARESTEALFGFLVRTPTESVQTSRVLSAVRSALREAGPQAVEHLRHFLASPNPNVRRTLVDVILRSRHPETVDLLEGLAGDQNAAIQRAAVTALGSLNSPEAVNALRRLINIVPKGAVTAALRTIAHPTSATTLRALGEVITEVKGLLTIIGERVPSNARVQGVREHYPGEIRGREWRPVGPHSQTGPDGAFYLLLEGQLDGLHLKVVLQGEETPLFSPVLLRANCENTLRVHVDCVLHRLLIEVEEDAERE